MNNKSKRILALTSAAAILATSMPITAFAEVDSNNGLEIGPEIGVHSNVRATTTYKWRKYSTKDTIKPEWKVYDNIDDLPDKFNYYKKISTVTIDYWRNGVDYSYDYYKNYNDMVNDVRSTTKRAEDITTSGIWAECGSWTGSVHTSGFVSSLQERTTLEGASDIYMYVTNIEPDGWTRDESVGTVTKAAIFTNVKSKSKNNYLETVTSNYSNSYPNDGEKNGYWYVYEGSETIYEADNFTPQVSKVTVPWGKPVNITGSVKNLPSGARLEDITNPKIDTRVSGEKTARGKITFKDGSTKIVENIPVIVSKSESENFTPQVKDNIQIKKGNEHNIINDITNIPPSAKAKIKTNIDTNTVGKQTGVVTITFNDNSTKTVNVPVEVIYTQADKFKDKNKDNKTIHVDSKDPITVVKGEQPNLSKIVDEIKDKEKNPDVKNVTTPDADTTKTGEGKAKVEVEFNDGSKTTIDVPINIVDTDAIKFKETLQTIIAYKDETLSNDVYKKAITNLPKDLKDFKVATPLDTSKSGDSTAKVSLTFKDNSTKEIALNAKVLEVPKTKTVGWGKKLELTEGIAGLSDKDQVEDITKPAINTKESGKKTGKIKVTLGSGETREFEIEVTIKPSEAETNTKIGTQKITVPWGTDFDIKKGITNLPKDATVKDISDPAIDTKESGDYTAKAEITFADGSTKTVEKIPVTISKSESENFKPVYKPVEVKKGDTIDDSKPNDFVTNLQDGSSVEITNKPSTDKPGTVYIEGKISFKDGSEQPIKIPVTVKEWDSVTYKDKVGIADEHVVYGGNINLTDNLTGEYPKGTNIEDITNPKVDTKVKGNHTGKAKIIFPDGTTLEKDYKVIVADPMSDTFPKEANVTKDEQPWGKELDPNKIITNIPEGSKDISITGIDTKKSGEQDGIVKITYPDGSKGEVPVKVTISKSEAENFNPNIKDITVKRTRPADINQPFNNLPNGASVKVKTPVDTKEVGNKKGVVTVTFSDTSTKDINIPVTVTPLESDTFKPVVEDEIVTWGTEYDLTDNIKNKPADATVEDVTSSKINTKKPGNYTGKVRITFSDKSTQEVTIPVKVNKSESENFKNKFNEKTDIIPEEVIKGNPIDLTDNIKNLPDGVVVEDITNPAIDTNKVGDQTATAKITFNDGSTMEVQIPVKVVVRAGMITPVPSVGKSDIEDENVNWSGEIDLTDNIKNLPEGSKVKDITEPKIDTTKSGEYTGKVEITYPDGSKRIVEVPIVVDKSQAEKYKENPSIEPERIPRNGKIDLNDNIKDLPEGSTVVDTTKDKIDTSQLGSNTGTVEVTFPDGTKAEFEVPIEVYKTEAEAFGEPITTKEVVNKGGEIDLTDNVVNLPEDAKVIDTTDPKIDTNKLGDYTATAKIVFKDGSETEIEIRVVVTDGKIDDTDNSGNDGNISGIITNDTNSSYNGPRDFRFNVKSDGDTPEYKTKSDENSQENKHKALDDLLNGISNLGRRNNVKSNENTTKYVFKIGEKSYKTIHGDNVTSHKMDVAPYIKNDRTMMPLRYVAEAIGADVQWDNSTRTAYFEKDGLVAKIQIDGNKIVMSNGKVYEMDAKPDNINDRILVSITNVSKVFNLTNGHTKDGINQNIEWNNDNRTVTIVK